MLSPPESSTAATLKSQSAAQSHMAAAAAAAAVNSTSVSPFMTSFLSSLPFSQSVFPQLIDMSSTQALVTLVSAHIENEKKSLKICNKNLNIFIYESSKLHTRQ